MAFREDAVFGKATFEKGIWLGQNPRRPVKNQALLDVGTFCKFDAAPVCSSKAGGAATGATGDENAMIVGPNAFEYHILGLGQTILAPQQAANGLDIGMDQAADEGVEISQGILAGGKHAFVVGTDKPFYFRVLMNIADVSGTDDCLVGFRKAEAYQAAVDNYDEMAALNVIAGAINIETILNGGVTSTTDTTDTVGDGVDVELEVRVNHAGVVTFLINGGPPTVTNAFTFDDAEVVVPFLYFLHAVDVAGVVLLKEWECGYLSAK